MSEYQYYEFQAIDHPLDRAAQAELRSISSRARITATRFVNHYEWGDFRGDPRKLVERWFDLHLYLANWGTRRLMIRVPARFLNRADIDPFLRDVDWIEMWVSGDHAIVDIHREDDEGFGYDEEDDEDRLAALAPLRADLIAGDLRLFYLLWLTAVENELVPDDVMEPLPGIGPLTDALQGFARFFVIDFDLVQAAAELVTHDQATSENDRREILAAIPEGEKIELLRRVFEGDTHVASELRKRLHTKHPPSLPRRSAGALRQRAREIRKAYEEAESKRDEAARRRQAKDAEQARRVRLEALKVRGIEVWREIEEEIERRNAAGYDRAASLLSDLEVLSMETGSHDDFLRRLASIRTRHGQKRKFIERLTTLGGGEERDQGIMRKPG